MPKSFPNLYFANPSGLQLAYDATILNASGTSLPVPGAPTVIRGPGGNYLLLATYTGFTDAASAQSWSVDYDGGVIAHGIADWNETFSHMAAGFAGNAGVPFFDLNNVIDVAISGHMAVNSGDNFLLTLIPNIHGNHFFVADDTVATANQIDIPFTAGVTGRYVLLATVFSAVSVGGTPGLVDILVDGVLQATISTSYNVANTMRQQTPYPFVQNLTAGPHSISFRRNGGGNVTVMGAPRVFGFWDPSALMAMGYGGYPQSLDISLAVPSAVGKPYMVFGGTTWFGTAIFSFGWDIGYPSSGFAPINYTFNKTNDHLYIGTCLRAVTVQSAASIAFRNDGSAGINADVNDRTFLLAMPSRYVG